RTAGASEGARSPHYTAPHATLRSPFPASRPRARRMAPGLMAPTARADPAGSERPPQIPPLAPHDRRPRRHEDRAVVARRADLVGPVGRDRLAFREGLEAHQWPHETEVRRLDHAGAEQFEA